MSKLPENNTTVESLPKAELRAILIGVIAELHSDDICEWPYNPNEVYQAIKNAAESELGQEVPTELIEELEPWINDRHDDYLWELQYDGELRYDVID